ncbi:MAG TPA: glycosyltransferase family 39 protein [Tepidisphaeraceae bacterium]|nr:glycosyltransferase family 39 protein [Tepidisphaeraceae bacterium]
MNVTLQSAPIFSDDVDGSAEAIRPLRGGVALAPGDWADLDREELDRKQRRWAMIWEVLAVLAITALGAGLRFTWLDKPAIWGDESATYARVCGTYAQLVDQLRGWGFVPLHYELYWWLRTWLLQHGRMLTPVLMRVPVAIFSTLTIPAMYLLARQLVRKSAALIVALITATSAYMLFYAHDAKMYADSWLFCTLMMAAFVWWLRKGSIMAWLAWVAAGAIAAGIHAPGMALLGVQLIWLIAQRHHRWWKTLAFLAGAAVIAAGPAYYYESFTKWGSNIEDRGWGASGLDWVNQYNATRDGTDLVRFTATAYLFAWEWPTVDTVHDIDPQVLMLCQTASAAVLVLLMLGIFPWPTRRRHRMQTASPPAIVSEDETHWASVAGLKRMLRAGAPTAWWRTALWIAVWIIVPTYGIYLVSVPNAESPMAWWRAVHDWLSQPWNAAVAAAAGIAAFYCCAATITSRIARTLQIVSVLFIPVLICFGLRELLKVQSPGNVWMPRYLGFIWPGVAIAGTVLLLRLPGAALRWGAVGLVIAMNLVNGIERMTKYTEPPMPVIVRDLYDSAESHGRIVTACDFVQGGADPGRQAADGTPARYYLLIDGKTQIRPEQFFQWDFEPHLFYSRDTDPSDVANDVHDNPRADRLIVWHVHHKKAPPRDYAPALGPKWHLISAQQYHLFQYWNWNALNWLDRDEYEKTKSKE